MRFDSSSSSLPLCGSLSREPLFSGNSTVPISRKWLCVAAVVLLLPWGLYNGTVAQMRLLQAETEELQKSQGKRTHQINSKRKLIEAYEERKGRLEKSNESAVLIVRKMGRLTDTHADNYEKLEKREEAMIKRIDDLESHIQDNSRYLIEKNYGTGPYRVELVVRSKAHMRVKMQKLVIQLAPLNLMPHSAHHFLRMLAERLWEEMSFMPQESAPHRIQASPVNVETLESMDWRFENAKLKNLAFAEHSSDFRCGSYSVGFSGNPGGPDFYINGLLIRAHPANDSCFARVVEGKEIIDSIIDKQESPVLGIESLRLLPQDESTKE